MNLRKWSHIKSATKRQGASFSMIARKLDVSVSAVVRVGQGGSRSARIESEIAATTGVDPRDLWPGWYREKAS